MLPGTAEWRRRIAFAFLMLGGVLAVRTVARDVPKEQVLVFRLDGAARHEPIALHASLTRIGESEARAGFSFTRHGDESADPREIVNLPDGDYVVTIDVTFRDEAAKEYKTSRAERVSLRGGEIIVPLMQRVRE
jgi:hypothetical protein